MCEVWGVNVLVGVLFDHVGAEVCAEVAGRRFPTLGDKIGGSFIDLWLWELHLQSREHKAHS